MNAVLGRVDHDYGLGEDLAELYDQATGDPGLAGPSERLRGMRVGCPEDAFEVGANAVMLQNCGIGRTPLKNRKVYFEENPANLPDEDMWQFKNFVFVP